MASICRVKTVSKGYGSSIESDTSSSSNGDSPHEQFIAGMTAGTIGKGHADAHSNYLSSVKNMETYVGKGGSDGGDSSGFEEIKDFLKIIGGLTG